MNQDPVKVKQIEWTSVLPSLHLVKAVRFGFRVRTFVPAFAAVVLVQVVLTLLSSTDSGSNLLRGKFGLFGLIQRSDNPIQVLATTSWWLMNSSDVSVTTLLTVCVLVQIIVLAFGVGISRAVASEFCMHERSGALRNLKLTARRTSAAVKISIAFLAFGLIAYCPVLIARGFAWLVGSGSFLTSVWPVLSLVAIPVILTWVVLMITGPLAAAAIAADNCDPADAVSRAINYVLSHKLRLFLMVSASFALARLSGSLAELLISSSTGITASGLPEPVTQIRNGFLFGYRSGTSAWLTMVQLITTAVEFAVLQSALTIGYVLLRHQEDAVPYRELSRID